MKSKDYIEMTNEKAIQTLQSLINSRKAYLREKVKTYADMDILATETIQQDAKDSAIRLSEIRIFEILLRKFKILCILASLYIFTGCSQNKCVENKKTYKYTIWVGSNSLSCGFRTNSYKDSCEYIIFTKIDSTIAIFPKSRIVEIDINKQ